MSETETQFDPMAIYVNEIRESMVKIGRAYQAIVAMGGPDSMLAVAKMAADTLKNSTPEELAFVQEAFQEMGPVLGETYHRAVHMRATERTIRDLLAASKSKSQLPDQAPAIECAVMFAGGATIGPGALSETAAGGLRMLSPAHPNDPRQRGLTRGTMLMNEHFFDYMDVMLIVVGREVVIEAPSIIHTS